MTGRPVRRPSKPPPPLRHWCLSCSEMFIESRHLEHCDECGEELATGRIPGGTLHFIGNGLPGMSLDQDLDAWAPTPEEGSDED